ncbi:MFS transporter [Dactylosporangium siamense]|uniref:MFS transporter n=1 Tax=Dactylosporangium siamense TaxID=685454 RepID=A0A919PW58_9ACTN|nr:MFS transporter [Dactylosporangium siamense]
MPVLLVGPFMAQADATIANVATPSIRDDLGASGPLLELVVGGYLIAFAVLLITGARLGQTYGYRRVFLLGVGLFTVASLLCGLAPNPTTLVLARVLQGIGAALMFPQTLTGIQLNFYDDARARAIGLYAIALSTGAVVGQFLGGMLICADLAGTHWRAIFLINVPVGVLVVLAGLRYLPADTHRTSRRLDLAGVSALSIALMLVVVPLILGHSIGWPLWTLACLVLAGPAIGGFLIIQRRVAARGGEPLIAVSVLARPAITWTLVTLMIATGTYYALLFTVAQYLQRDLRYSAAASGLTLVPWVAAFGLAGQLVRRLPERAARRAPVFGCLLLAAAYAAIAAVTLQRHHNQALLMTLLAAGGLGLGVQFSALIGHLTTIVATDYAADISGVSTTVMQIGAAVSVAAFGTLYFGLATHATNAFGVTVAALALTALAASLTAYRAIRQSPTGSDAAAAGPRTPIGAKSG